ncbi:MAG: hypothetical protein Q4E06_01620 [Lautropia sp.]|nr:hypothetical protein [Lautropia sp.]
MPASPDATGTAPAPIVLPAEIEAIDVQVQAALVMVARGIHRLSRLAGNIRFAFLQRDESRLANERKALKDAFGRQEKTEAELKFGLQTVLQKAERMAGSLLYVPTAQVAGTATPVMADAPTEAASPAPEAAPAPAAEAPGRIAAATPAVQADAGDTGQSSDNAAPADTTRPAVPAADAGPATPGGDAAAAGTPVDATAAQPAAHATEAAPATQPAPATSALPMARSNQIRQSVRKAMMALAPAAPLHLQIELAADFGETDPDIMGMAARIHALHRQVLGSLKSIHWHSAVRCTLGFDDGRTLVVEFGEQGLKALPAAFRQNRSADQGAGKGGQTAREARNGQARAQSARSGQRGVQPPGADGRKEGSKGRRDGERRRRGGDGNRGEQGGQARRAETRRQPPDSAQQQTLGPQAPGKPHAQGPRPERRRTDGDSPGLRHAGRREGGAGRRPPRREGERHERSGQGQQARGGRHFPGNSAMADKLREALGGALKLPGSNKEGTK